MITSPAVAGFGDYRGGRVRLHPDLVQAEARCTLAHEIVHHEHRDDILGYCAVGWLNGRVERSVHAIAARRLIVVSELIEALRWSPHPAEVAEQLVVDARTLYTWVHGMTGDDYRELIQHVSHRVRRPLADLRNEAERRIPWQRTG